MKKIILAGVIAALALVSLPAASFAYGGGSPVVTGTVAPTETVTVDWPAGFFEGGELVTVEVTCTAGSPTINNELAPPVIFRAVSSGTYETTGAGAFSLNLTLPAGDFGTCSCQVLGLRSDTTGTTDLAYVPGAAIPYTGFDTGLYVWTGAGVLVLGVALVTIVMARRRSQSKEQAKT